MIPVVVMMMPGVTIIVVAMMMVLVVVMLVFGLGGRHRQRQANQSDQGDEELFHSNQ